MGKRINERLDAKFNAAVEHALGFVQAPTAMRACG